jgi:hypothetical protein
MGMMGAVTRFAVRLWGHSTRLTRLDRAMVACVLGLAIPAHAELDDIRFRLTGDVTYDDNVSRARGDDQFHDTFLTVNAGASVPFEMTSKTRLVLTGNIGGDKFDHFSGLNRTYANIQGEFQYRNSGEFGEPIWAVFARQGQDWYESDLRDGYRFSGGVSVRKPVTDRIFFFSAFTYNDRDSSSSVFDNRDISLRANVDYTLTRRQTLYFGLEARDGDIVSTAKANLKYLDIAEAVVKDDVFTDTTRFSYRLKAYTGIGTLGYNFAFAERAAFDFSYRYVYSKPQEQPNPAIWNDTIYYTDQQVTASLLIRF